MRKLYATIQETVADTETKRIAWRLIEDAVTRKREIGDFNMYAAFSGMPGKAGAIDLYDNPTGGKHEFIPVIQIFGALLCASHSALVSESWYLNLEGKTPEQIADATRWVDQGLPVSKHPDAQEGIFVHIETDESMFDVSISIAEDLSLYNPRAFVSDGATGQNAQGEMIGFRLDQKAKALLTLQPGLVPPASVMAALRKEWFMK